MLMLPERSCVCRSTMFKLQYTYTYKLLWLQGDIIGVGVRITGEGHCFPCR